MQALEEGMDKDLQIMVSLFCYCGFFSGLNNLPLYIKLEYVFLRIAESPTLLFLKE